MVNMPKSPRIVVGVTGRIGSGKTSLARALEQDLGFQYVRYSQVLADWFKADSSDKIRLQRIGGDVMTGAGQRELNRLLISKIEATGDVVVDGLRHPIDFESLHSYFGRQFFLIYVDVPALIRFNRLSSRFASIEEFKMADARPVESNIDSLRSMASVILPGTMLQDAFTSKSKSLVPGFREKVVG